MKESNEFIKIGFSYRLLIFIVDVICMFLLLKLFAIVTNGYFNEYIGKKIINSNLFENSIYIEYPGVLGASIVGLIFATIYGISEAIIGKSLGMKILKFHICSEDGLKLSRTKLLIRYISKYIYFILTLVIMLFMDTKIYIPIILSLILLVYMIIVWAGTLRAISNDKLTFLDKLLKSAIYKKC